MNDYEIHITIDPDFERINLLLGLINDLGFRMAKLIMRKDLGPEQISRDDMFITAHRNTFFEAKQATIDMCSRLVDHHFSIRRYKIEQIIIDSRLSDQFSILE